MSAAPKSLRAQTPHLAVSLALNGETFLNLESNALSGLQMTPEREAAVRTAAERLLALVGSKAPGRPASAQASEEVVPDWLAMHTYRVEHNPNCPSAYLVRLIGRGMGRIHGDARDAKGYGRTLAEAAQAAESARVGKPAAR